MLKMSRLPGRSVKGFGVSFQRHQLWMSGEYLLYREINGYREEVKRFYYGDIQAIVCGPTRHWRVFSYVCSSIVALCIVWVAYILAQDSPRFVLMLPGFLLGAFVPLLLGNLLLGPSCKTTLYTATSEAPLYSLGRVRSARKAIDRLLPFIKNAQASYVLPTAEAAASDPDAVAPAAEVVEPAPHEAQAPEDQA